MHEAVAALQAQLGENSPLDASQMPTDIKDAIDMPDKLKYFKNAVETLASMPESGMDDSMVSAAKEIDKKTLSQLYDIVNVRLPQIDTELANLEVKIKTAETVLEQVESKMVSIDDAYKQAEAWKITAVAGFGAGSAQIASARSAMEDAKVNGQPGVVLSIFKGSTAGTSDVSKACKQAITRLQEKYPGLQITPLVDQGDYISMIIDSIVSSMVIGAFLAILILAVFLMDIRPTLVVALTVVPTMGSVLLKRAKPKEHRIFEKIQEVYGVILKFCLRFKILPLGIAIALLALCISAVLNMGIVLIPDMGSDQISVTVTMPEEDEKETVYEKADKVMDAILAVDGVSYVGGMDATGTADIEAATKDIDCDVTVSNSMMGEMDEMLGSGLQIDIHGSDLEQLVKIGEDITGMVETIDGFTNVTNGQEEADEEIHLNINKDKSMELGLTGAQIYGDITDRLTTDKTAVTLTVDDKDMDVKIIDETDLLTKENLMDMEFETETKDDDGNTVKETHKLREFATLSYGTAVSSISRSNGNRMMSVTAETKDGYNTTLLSRKAQDLLDAYEMPEGYSCEFGRETSNTADMITQMGKLMLLGFLLIYLVMVAQFQSLLSPFIVIFTVPLAFTGGLLAMLLTGGQMSLVTLMGFLVLMGTVVNNGIVFVDYTNQLRIGGMERRDALIATGETRMRPILMTAFTMILAMLAMVFSKDTASEMGHGMALVVAGGLFYATFMTMFIVPVMYDILYRKEVHVVDVGGDDMDDVPDDAAEFMEELNRKN